MKGGGISSPILFSLQLLILSQPQICCSQSRKTKSRSIPVNLSLKGGLGSLVPFCRGWSSFFVGIMESPSDPWICTSFACTLSASFCAGIDE
uniref:Secreted protein n=1 Tax=Physcomitrium patens TaxID=3218 RepID=A0A2K1JZB0_PHYPA|nr:hypothetical protein PHYPA_013983 [Physcomitrium patens]